MELLHRTSYLINETLAIDKLSLKLLDAIHKIILYMNLVQNTNHENNTLQTQIIYWVNYWEKIDLIELQCLLENVERTFKHTFNKQKNLR